MNTRTTLLTLLLLTLLAAPAFASLDRQDDDEAARRRAESVRRWGHAFELYSFSSFNPLNFDFGFANMKIGGEDFTGLLTIRFKEKMINTDFTFSFYILEYYHGSPGYDEVAIPRTSLNKCPYTGWFYFDK
jgi:hypothetical protein